MGHAAWRRNDTGLNNDARSRDDTWLDTPEQAA
jgi:hypothetical protein